jgi:hypothetical protein
MALKDKKRPTLAVVSHQAEGGELWFDGRSLKTPAISVSCWCWLLTSCLCMCLREFVCRLEKFVKYK